MSDLLKRRLESKVMKFGDCLVWTAGKLPHGYGMAHWNKERMLAHRLSFFLANGFLPEVVMHSCDNPSCVNPDHLKAGTQKDNLADMVSKGRSNRGERHYNVRLTRDDVIKIRSSNISHKQIAEHYGISQGHVSDIKNGRRWKEVL